MNCIWQFICYSLFEILIYFFLPQELELPNSDHQASSSPGKPLSVVAETYVPSSTAIDKRKFISNQAFPIDLMDPAFCFSIVSYNILADCHLRRLVNNSLILFLEFFCCRNPHVSFLSTTKLLYVCLALSQQFCVMSLPGHILFILVCTH